MVCHQQPPMTNALSPRVEMVSTYHTFFTILWSIILYYLHTLVPSKTPVEEFFNINAEKINQMGQKKRCVDGGFTFNEQV